MNETKPTDSADTPSKASEPSAPEQTSPVEAKGALNAAKEKARAAAEGVKDLKQKLAKHDIKAELREAFAETKKNPASLWKKPETLRPGKDLAVVGLAASVVLLLLLLVTSGSLAPCSSARSASRPKAASSPSEVRSSESSSSSSLSARRSARRTTMKPPPPPRVLVTIRFWWRTKGRRRAMR